VTLTIPADASYTRVYYFCHIHGGMSAEIEISGSSAATTTTIAADMLGAMTEAEALAVYTGIVAADQATLATFDETCGTHASSHYAPSESHASCDGLTFLCGDGATGTYSDCLQAVDCQMHHDMAVSVPSTSTSKFATFARQMIPHHQNAVAMAKVLLKLGTSDDYPASGTEDQDQDWAEGLIREIINVQNFQIQGMQAWIDANPTLAETSTQCYDGTTSAITGSVVTTASSASTILTGVECTPSSTTLALKWNAFASEWGAYEVTGCTGVNPKLMLTAGTTYTFDQSDASNW